MAGTIKDFCNSLLIYPFRYDAGDHVKFNFPMAYSTTVLAWGIISFEQGYIAAGELENALDSIKWVTDYLMQRKGERGNEE